MSAAGFAVFLDRPNDSTNTQRRRYGLAVHKVESVKKGERLAAVGWARSFIRSFEQRENYF
jgi:hypothetical protein